MTRTAVVLGAVLASVVACGAATTPEPRQADVVRIADQFPGTTLAELEKGRSLYLSRCSSCHAPVSPASVPAERWPHEVEEMSERARLGSDEPLVVKYLVAQALRSESSVQEK
ncbi:MAG TPA: hypothetical protein VFU02_00405 [Polyangiaceae bacterium]|nr:hypothetical protein [Polyangiaceae bacterium]